MQPSQPRGDMVGEALRDRLPVRGRHPGERGQQEGITPAVVVSGFHR